MSQYQQPQYPYQQPTGEQWQPQQPPAPKKRGRSKVAIGCGALAGLVVVIVGIAIIVSTGNGNTSTSTDSSSQATQAPTKQATAQPTISAKDLEATYKASTTNTTVSELDKNGNTWNGNDVHFTAVIFGFVKDNSGNTAGANVDDPNGGSGVIQIAFPAGTDISQLNQGDTIEIWGTDGGTASGQNAFGATVQEVVVSALYLTDKTTGYQTQ